MDMWRSLVVDRNVGKRTKSVKVDERVWCKGKKGGWSECEKIRR